MIELAIRNPFSQCWDNLVNKSWLIKPNKAAEFNIYRTNVILLLNLYFTPKTNDHSGWRFELGLLGVEMEFHYYDTRHADKY